MLCKMYFYLENVFKLAQQIENETKSIDELIKEEEKYLAVSYSTFSNLYCSSICNITLYLKLVQFLL